MILALPHSPLYCALYVRSFDHMANKCCIATRDTNPRPTLTASPSRFRHLFTAKKGTWFFPGTLQSLDGIYILLFWVTGTWTPFCPVAMDTGEWERENLNDAASKKKKKEIKVAVRINEPSESLPSLYFSLASALSLASKYQTVMAYLRDKEDKKKVRLQMISFVNQKSLFIYNGVVGHSDTRLQFQNKRSNFSLQSLNWPDRSPCSQV